MQFSIDINSMTEVLKLITNAILEFKFCVEHGGLCRDNQTNVNDALDFFNITEITGKNASDVSQEILNATLVHCTAWDHLPPPP